MSTKGGKDDASGGERGEEISIILYKGDLEKKLCFSRGKKNDA